MVAILLALGASLFWGVGDFIGGVQSRRWPVLTIVVISQTAGLLVVAVLVGARAMGPPDLQATLASVGAGVVGALALATFFRAFAIGKISVVAPIVATSAIVPVVGGLVQGERPGALQLVGIAIAIGGVVLVSQEQGAPISERPASRLSIALAVVTALLFGLALVGLDLGAEEDPYWSVLIFRIATVTAIVGALLVLQRRPTITRRDFRLIVIVGLLDVTATLMFAVAASTGLLSVVGVLSSLFPVMTIALARIRLGERLAQRQLIGVVLTLLGVALIAAG